MEPPVLHFSGLSRSHDSMPAILNASGELYPGDLISLQGPNGAGKSTLLGLLAGLLRQATGTVRTASGIRIGLLAHSGMSYPRLTGEENLRFFAALAGTDDPAGRVQEALRITGLWRARFQRAEGYSRGMQTRLSLARLIVTRPDVILWDEPYTGLDTEGQSLLDEWLANRSLSNFSFSAGILADHDPVRMNRLCNRHWTIENHQLREILLENHTA